MLAYPEMLDESTMFNSATTILDGWNVGTHIDQLSFDIRLDEVERMFDRNQSNFPIPLDGRRRDGNHL